MTASELKSAEPASTITPGAGTETTPASGPAHKGPKRTRRPWVWTRFRFGIQSKILIAMLLSSILGVAVIGRGPATANGLHAATYASRSGSRVLIIYGEAAAPTGVSKV